jgi:drug/metabolite transporter (DMT)-like permease
MSPPLKLHRVRLLAAFATIYIVWGSSYMVTRIGVMHLPALLLGGMRYSCAGAIMLLVAAVSGRRVRPQAGEWRGLAVLAFFGVLLTNGIGVWAAQYVASNKSALLNATVPCWIVLLGTFGARSHRPDWRQLTGLACGFAGTVLVVQPSGGAHSNLFPQLMILVACLNWAVSTTYMRNVRSRLPMPTLLGWQMLLGGLVMTVIAIAHGDIARWHWSLVGVLSLVFLIVFGSCLAFTAYAYLARRTTPTRLGTYGYVNPAIAAVLGWLVLNERLTELQLLGMGITLGGVLLINWPRRS